MNNRPLYRNDVRNQVFGFETQKQSIITVIEQENRCCYHYGGMKLSHSSAGFFAEIRPPVRISIDIFR